MNGRDPKWMDGGGRFGYIRTRKILHHIKYGNERRRFPGKALFFCVLLYGRTLYYVGSIILFLPYRDLGLRRVQDVKHCYYHLLLRKWGGARPRRVVSFVVIA